MPKRAIVRVSFERTKAGQKIILYSRSDRGTLYRVDEVHVERGDSSRKEFRVRVAGALAPDLSLVKDV